MKRREMRAMWELRRLLGSFVTIEIAWVTTGDPWHVFADFGVGRTFLASAVYLADALEGACGHVRRIALAGEQT
jgi:hypothetical protein